MQKFFRNRSAPKIGVFIFGDAFKFVLTSKLLFRIPKTLCGLVSYKFTIVDARRSDFMFLLLSIFNADCSRVLLNDSSFKLKSEQYCIFFLQILS